MEENNKSINLDSSDLKILSAVRANGRETMTKISADTGIQISLVFDRLKRMEEEGLIGRYSCSVDWKQLGLNRRVLLFLRMPEHLKQKAEARLARNHHINNLWRLNDKCGLAAEAMFVSLRQQEVFVAALRKEFKDIQISSHVVVDNPKWEGFLTFCLGCRKIPSLAPPRGPESKKVLFSECLN